MIALPNALFCLLLPAKLATVKAAALAYMACSLALLAAARFTEPGILPAAVDIDYDMPDAKITHALVRGQKVPLADHRARYSRHTDVVVARLDHYCSWVGNPIGARNYFSYVAFLAWATVNLVRRGGRKRAPAPDPGAVEAQRHARLAARGRGPRFARDLLHDGHALDRRSPGVPGRPSLAERDVHRKGEEDLARRQSARPRVLAELARFLLSRAAAVVCPRAGSGRGPRCGRRRVRRHRRAGRRGRRAAQHVTTT